jgi:hypothetical protein
VAVADPPQASLRSFISSLMKARTLLIKKKRKDEITWHKVPLVEDEISTYILRWFVGINIKWLTSRQMEVGSLDIMNADTDFPIQ